MSKKQIVVYVLIAILGTLLTTTVLAAFPPGAANPNGIVSKKKNNLNPDGLWVEYDMIMEEEYDMLCSENGTYLPSKSDGSTILSATCSCGKTHTEDLPYLTANNKGNKKFSHTVAYKSAPSSADFGQKSYQTKTYGYYKRVSSHTPTPKEAYILAEMKDNYVNEKNYVQYAWWDTDAGTNWGKGDRSSGNGVSKTADDFEAYIYGLAGTSSLTYKNQTYNTGSGTGTVKAPVIKYEPSWNKDADQNGVVNEADEVTVSFDGNKQEYIVGPFSIDYVKSVTEHNSEKYVFSDIVNATLISNLGQLTRGTDWEFVWLANQQRDLEEGYNFPNPNEVFYVSIKYKVGLTNITGFNFDFKYMNAGGTFDTYEGKYGICTWTAKYKNNYHTESYEVTNDDGTTTTKTKKVYDDTTQWLQMTGYEQEDAQTFTHGIIAARWYNYTNISRSWDLGQAGYIRIEKETVDANGARLPINDTFYFNIYVDGKLFQTVSIKTKDGYGARTSEIIKWAEVAPSYRVEEVNYDSTRFVPNGPWEGTMSAAQTIEIKAKNTVKPREGYLQINKKLVNPSAGMQNRTYNFRVIVTGDFTYGGQRYNATVINPFVMNVSINSGSGWKWISNKFTWNDDAPRYTVEEIIPDNANFELLGMIQGMGYLISGETKNVTATNSGIPKDRYDRGRIQLKKTYVDANGNEIEGKVFKFRITVGNESYIVEVESGTMWRSGYFYWEKGTSAPSYTIEEIEIPSGCTVSIDKPRGRLEAENQENNVKGIVNVIARNTARRVNQSRIKIDKNITVKDNRLTPNDVTGIFTFNVTVTGTFFYNGVSYVDTSMTIGTQISKGTNWSWTSMPIYWYDKAPTYSVEEVDIPENWRLVSMSPNASGSLTAGSTVNVVCANEWEYVEKLVLTMKIGGKVWDDTDRSQNKHVDARENGKIDEGEAGIANIFVKVYRVISKADGSIVERLEDVYAYDDKNLTSRISATTYTDDTGNWSIGAISVPAFRDAGEKASFESRYGSGLRVSYDVEFYYDGQTYEPTTFLATSNGDASRYKNASTAGRDAYLYNSMAIDDPNGRIAFNNTFENITGEKAMDENGLTDGLAKNGSGTSVKELHYSSKDSASLINADNIRKISTLNTTNKDGQIYNELIMTSRTSNGGLTYPFDDKMHLMHWDKTITDINLTQYKYSALYNYCLSINLGLIEREATDLALEKDLTMATVVVNGKVLKYRYNSAIDLDDPDNWELLYKQIAVADEQIEYNLGLYSSDYYYRASVYNGSVAGGAIDGFYKKVLNLPKETTEMEIFLTYTIRVHNQSETYTARVNEIADYFDSTFELIKPSGSSQTDYEKMYRYVQKVNGKSVDNVIQVAYPSTVTYYTSGNRENGTYNVDWVEGRNRRGSDGVEYTRMTTNSLRGKTLESGERAEISVTFRVEKDNFNNAGVQDVIKLGKKHNVAEITNFTSFYSNTSKNKWGRPGQIAGRVDEDSAPNNINLEYANEKSYYEDDTDSAPIITISLYDVDRAITGMVWDDSQTQAIEYNQTVGNGIYNPNEGDKVIKNLTTEIIEAISIPQAETDARRKCKKRC